MVSMERSDVEKIIRQAICFRISIKEGHFLDTKRFVMIDVDDNKKMYITDTC